MHSFKDLIKNYIYQVFSDTIQKFDFVRCMNVLNRSYFSDDVLIVGLRNLFHSLHPDGFLLIGRTDAHHVNRASLLKKVDDCLVVLNHFTGGTEIFDLIQKGGNITDGTYFKSIASFLSNPT